MLIEKIKEKAPQQSISARVIQALLQLELNDECMLFKHTKAAYISAITSRLKKQGHSFTIRTDGEDVKVWRRK